MAGFTLFPAQTGVKLTLQGGAAMIAAMRSRVACAASVAAALAGFVAMAACNEGLQPTAAPTSCPQGFVGICGTATFRGALPDSTQGLFIVAYATFPESLSRKPHKRSRSQLRFSGRIWEEGARWGTTSGRSSVISST